VTRIFHGLYVVTTPAPWWVDQFLLGTVVSDWK
jgi:hypothetical protein